TVALLARIHGGALESRLRLTDLRGAVLDPAWTLARSPAALQSDAIGILFQALAGAALAALAVGALGIVLIFAARASERVAEVTLRRAVGATRRGLVLAALLEGGTIAIAALCAGGLAGLVLARHAARGWPGTVTSATPADAVPSLVVAAVALLAVLAGAMLALIFAPRRRLVDAAPRQVSLVVPTLQLGTALALLTASGLAIRHADDPRSGVTAHPLDGEIYSGGVSMAEPAARSARYAALLERLRDGAAYDTVSLTGDGAAVGLGTLGVVTTDCGLCPAGGLLVPWHSVAALHQVVSADTFQSLGIQVLAGRGITEADRWGATPVAVVSRSLAARHFQNGDAIGRRLLFGDDPRTWHTVVGIVDDPRPTGLGGALVPSFAVYASVLQHPAPAVELMLRPRPGVPSGRPLDPELRRMFGGSAGTSYVSEAALASAQLAPVAWFGRLFAAEGCGALLAALAATLVQMRLWVRSLAPELGLRRAVGAGAGQVIALVLGRAALVAAGGVVVGLVLGPALWGAVGTVVRGLPAWDFELLARMAVLLVAVTMVGALAPAWHAARATPAALLAEPVA
ncbi:MAG: FtsX-like permease family protein, partial [Gemmatimonadales bacterium]